MKDSSPMNETRYAVITRNVINPKNKGQRSSIKQMVETFRLIYRDPQAMIEARKRAASHDIST
jgi:hypothetical protein